MRYPWACVCVEQAPIRAVPRGEGRACIVVLPGCLHFAALCAHKHFTFTRTSLIRMAKAAGLLLPLQES